MSLMADLQAVFEKVATHLFKQGTRSTMPKPDTTTCAYRGTCGRMCAVGILIPDTEYHHKMEYNTLNGLEFEWPQMPEWMKHGDGYTLMKMLQSAHDGAPYWETTATMRERLTDIGQQHNLDVAFLDQLSFEGR